MLVIQCNDFLLIYSQSINLFKIPNFITHLLIFTA